LERGDPATVLEVAGGGDGPRVQGVGGEPGPEHAGPRPRHHCPGLRGRSRAAEYGVVQAYELARVPGQVGARCDGAESAHPRHPVTVSAICPLPRSSVSWNTMSWNTVLRESPPRGEPHATPCNRCPEPVRASVLCVTDGDNRVTEGPIMTEMLTRPRRAADT